MSLSRDVSLRGLGILLALSAPALLHAQEGAPVFGGTITGQRGEPLAKAAVSLSLHRSDGETVWKVGFLTDDRGAFRASASDLPALPGIYSAVVAAEAEKHLAAKANVLVQITQVEKAGEAPHVVVSPLRVELRLPSLSPGLTLAVLVPAIVGLILAVLHLTWFPKWPTVSPLFAVGAASLWMGVTLWLAVAYVWSGDALLPLFWPDFVGASGTVVFAFLGTLVYVAYSLYQRGSAFFSTADLDERRQVVVTLGGRILVAPYVALVGQSVLASAFPALQAGPFAAFFGFFTGLWIKPVLEALNDLGTRFLSAEAQQRLLERLKREKAPEAPSPPTEVAAAFRPEPALVEAAAQARPLFLRLPGVIGVDVGLKVSGQEVGASSPAIIAYVYKKEDTQDSDRVPRLHGTFPTDVVALPGLIPATCFPLLSRLSWAKIHADNTARLGHAPASPAVQASVQGQIALLVDPSAELFQGKDSVRLFDAVGAFKLASLGVKHEFVSFVIDPDIWPSVAAVAQGQVYRPSDYHIGVFSDIAGTNYSQVTNPGWYAERGAWGSQALRACYVVTTSPLSLWTHLHELAHYWCAYVTLPEPGAHDLLVGAMGQQRFHWGEQFDSGRSCVDWDGAEWVELGDGLYEKRPLRHEREDQVTFCDLELYLMGLIGPSDVKPMRLLRDLQRVTGDRWRAKPEHVSIDRVIQACGKRAPAAAAPKSLHLATVVVSHDTASGQALAKGVDSFRADLEAAFKRATRDLATLDTRL